MLKGKRRKHDIYIYDGDKKLGYIFPAYSLDEMWVISTPDDLVFHALVPFEELFLKAFNHELDSIPNIRKKMKEAWEIKQSILLANTITDSARVPLQFAK